MNCVIKTFQGKKVGPKDKNYSKGIWQFRKRLNGKQVNRSLKGAVTREDAEKAARQIIDDAFNRKFGLARDGDFEAFTNGTYTRYFESVNTNISAKRLYVRTLIKAFKGKTLRSISPQDCRDLQTKLRKTLAASSVNLIMSTASKIFTLAGQEGILDKNPMQFVSRLKEPPPRNRLLTKEERERLWQELQKDELMFPLVLLAVNLPLRRGQLLAITPTAIDFQNSVLFSIASKGRDRRAVPLNHIAMTTLKDMLRDGHLPFPLKDFRKRWKRALRLAGVDDFRFHDLRKEFAAKLRKENVHSKTIQDLFGHSSMRITDVYLPTEFAAMREAVNSLDEKVQEAGGVQ